jgi:hypothetical protein
MEDDEKIEKRRALQRRMITLETTIDNLVKSKTGPNDKGPCKKISRLELELQILRLYYDVLDDLIKNPNYLADKNFQLKINQDLLEQLDNETKISLVCLTEGLCGIK